MTLKGLGYKPRRGSVRIILDDTAREAAEAARSEFALCRVVENKPDQGLGSDLPGLKAAVEETEAAADQAAVTFTFEALARPKLAELINACPPSAEQLERWKEASRNTPLVARSAPEFDYEKFAPKLIAASMVEPDTTEAEVTEMWENGDWSDAIWAQLWDTAWKVNQEVSTRPTYGTGSRKTPNSGP